MKKIDLELIQLLERRKEEAVLSASIENLNWEIVEQYFRCTL